MKTCLCCHLLLRRGSFFGYTLEVMGVDLHKFSVLRIPVLQHSLTDRTSCHFHVFLNIAINLLFLFDRIDLLQAHKSHVASLWEFAIWIINVGNTTTHSCTKVTSCLTQYHEISTRHVLGTVVASTFNNSQGTRVPHAKAFASLTAEECLARGGSIETNISDNNVIFRDKSIINDLLGGEYSNFTSRESLPSVIIGIALHRHCNSLSKGECKRLTSMTLHLDLDCVIRQTLLPKTLGDFVREHGTTRAVQIGNVLLEHYGGSILKRLPRLFDKDIVLRLVEAMVLRIQVAYTSGGVEF
mmetsp:Transcript_25687/g.55269  ORF Transcript_25687/g.55269 Transcript_25687/m.55269 type:complete len:298 (-) Transcript_25687:4002-4895(-)